MVHLSGKGVQGEAIEPTQCLVRLTFSINQSTFVWKMDKVGVQEGSLTVAVCLDVSESHGMKWCW